MSSLTMRLSKRALARANPDKNKKELDLLFVKYHYGDDLYQRVNQYLSRHTVASGPVRISDKTSL